MEFDLPRRMPCVPYKHDPFSPAKTEREFESCTNNKTEVLEIYIQQAHRVSDLSTVATFIFASRKLLRRVCLCRSPIFQRVFTHYHHAIGCVLMTIKFPQSFHACRYIPFFCLTRQITVISQICFWGKPRHLMLIWNLAFVSEIKRYVCNW